MQRPLSAISLLVLLSAGESACHKKQAVIPLPSPAPAASTAPTKPPPQPPSELGPPTALPPQNPNPPQPTPAETYQKNRLPPPAPAPSSRRQSPPRNTAPSTPTPAPTNASPLTPAVDPPRLGAMLTPDQQRQYNTDIDQSLQHAQTSLGAIRNRQLNKEQQDRLAQVRTFIQQAQTVRASDLPGAKSLAERAEVLARDLAASMQ